MIFKPLFALSVVLFVTVSARKIRDVSTDAEIPTISNLFDVINENFKKFGDTVSQSFDSQKFEDAGRNVAKQLDEWGANLKKETENMKDNEVVKSLRESVDKALDDIKKSPDVKAIFEKFQDGEKVLVPKLNEIRQTAEPQLKDLSKKILDQTTTTLQDIAKIFQQDVKQ